MHDLLLAPALMTGLTFAACSALALAARCLHVPEDPRLERVERLLGGSNCGACGEPGCRAFAEALIARRRAPGQCTAGPTDSIAEIADLLGVDTGGVEKRVARLHCAGGRSAVRVVASYRGLSSCAAAFAAQRGGRSCRHGCLGLGDCAQVCTFDAIAMNEEGLPVVAPESCTACGDCLSACPADLFSLQPVSQPVVVQCRSPLVGEAARASCAVACDACGRCALDAPGGAIALEDGLPRLRGRQPLPAQCTARCPSGAITWVDGRQFDYDVRAQAWWDRDG